ncbi:MAG: phosphoribosylglycinamide formyltransferase [Henriciella sp.]|jgi:formyltetrahydrofolate-dependent phosphoribosylglycinamide formyltransferase
MTMLRLAILISGRGSNMESILQAAEAEDYPLEPALVLSNRPNAAGLKIAEGMGIQTKSVDHTLFGKDREAFEVAMHVALKESKIDIIALAGFMRILTPWFVNKWVGRLVNIHPSLLPKYPGLNTHQRAIDAGDAHAGCSVHWVTEGVDEGQVIDQAKVAIATGETAASLAEKILPLEHALYPVALAKAARQITPR